MKKPILFLLAATAAVSCLFAQTIQSPFSKLGYKKQVMYTSSKGEFEEFHGNPDVVEIGSVYFDTKTNKVIGYISEEKEKTEVASAISAISIDPLCEKYYWITPYAYCMNNPVRFIDPDGRDLFDTNGRFLRNDNSNIISVQTAHGTVPYSSLAMNNMANRQTAANIAGYYGNQIGIHKPGNIGISNEPDENSSSSPAFITGKNIFVNAKGGINKLLDNKYNLMSALFHEKDHKDYGHGEKDISNITHAEVYLDQMGDKSFEKATTDYKSQTTGAFMSILSNAILKDGAQDSQIQGFVDQYNKLNTGYQMTFKRTGSDNSAYKLTITQNK